MMAETQKGKEVRLYYLKIEEAWNTPEMIAARAQQMGINLNWKDPPVSRIKEIRMAYDKGIVTVNEYRWKAFYLPPFEIGVPLDVTKRYPLTESEAKAVMAEEVHIARRKRRLNPLVSGFAENFWDITGLEDDFVTVEDVYAKFKEAVGSQTTRNVFVRQLKDVDSRIIYKQKKINGYPVLVFSGIKLRPVVE